MSQMRALQERGNTLGVSILTAIICSIAAYLILFLATGQARHARFYRQRVRARYAAEAAIVWAQQRLRADPTYCNTSNPPPLEGYQVQVTVTNCGAGNTHQLQARVLNY